MSVRALKFNRVLLTAVVVMAAFIATALLPGVVEAQTTTAKPPAAAKPQQQPPAKPVPPPPAAAAAPVPAKPVDPAAKPETPKPDAQAPAKTKLTLESLAGTWDGVAQTPNGDLPVHTVLTFQDGKLTGTIESQMGVSPITSAKLTDDVLEVGFELQGAPGTFNGKIAGDKFEGSWAYGADSGPIALARVPPPAPVKK